MDKTEADRPKKRHKKDRAAEIANTFEWLITALILALLVRAFVMEAYRMPTGSMASTLKGYHFRLRCPQCGYRYGYGLGNFGLGGDVSPRRNLRPQSSRCPSCGFFQQTGGLKALAKGDQILVLKCIYQFFKPKRWDVIVFKSPVEPHKSFIKRLIALPGETVQIIDGDIYIDGKIARKPPKVQDELWMPIYDNDYQPVLPKQGSFNGHFWQQPLKNIEGASWQTTPEQPTIFTLDSTTDQMHYLFYDDSVGNNFRATYAYNTVNRYPQKPLSSDLMVRFYTDAQTQGAVGIELSKYTTNYRASVEAEKEMVITRIDDNGRAEVLATKAIDPSAKDQLRLVKFANVDHQLIFEFGDDKLTFDLGTGPDDAGRRTANIPPQVKIFGSGRQKLSHIAIFRDTHYTPRHSNNGPEATRPSDVIVTVSAFSLPVSLWRGPQNRIFCICSKPDEALGFTTATNTTNLKKIFYC